MPLRRWAPESAAIDVVGWLDVLCLPGMAVAFLVGLLRARLFAGEALQGLGVAAA